MVNGSDFPDITNLELLRLYKQMAGMNLAKIRSGLKGHGPANDTLVFVLR